MHFNIKISSLSTFARQIRLFTYLSCLQPTREICYLYIFFSTFSTSLCSQDRLDCIYVIVFYELHLMKYIIDISYFQHIQPLYVNKIDKTVYTSHFCGPHLQNMLLYLIFKSQQEKFKHISSRLSFVVHITQLRAKQIERKKPKSEKDQVLINQSR